MCLSNQFAQRGGVFLDSGIFQTSEREFHRHEYSRASGQRDETDNAQNT